jgi:hypothetical protein
MSGRRLSDRDCARALWLLGLNPPVTADQLTTAWRTRVSRAHPDRHIASQARTEAAHVMTRALNEARMVVAEWIASGRDWPNARGRRELRFDQPEPWPEREPDPKPAPIDRHTGLRRGDLVRLWPYDSDVESVAGIEREPGGGRVWVHLEGGGSAPSERIRLAAFSCPVCGLCAGPVVESVRIRPCPACLVDLRRIEREPAEATRVRAAIEARAQAGAVTADDLADPALADRARERQRWARRLRTASADDLHAALLSAFGRAFERWSTQQ